MAQASTQRDLQDQMNPREINASKETSLQLDYKCYVMVREGLIQPIKYSVLKNILPESLLKQMDPSSPSTSTGEPLGSIGAPIQLRNISHDAFQLVLNWEEKNRHFLASGRELELDCEFFQPFWLNYPLLNDLTLAADILGTKILLNHCCIFITRYLSAMSFHDPSESIEIMRDLNEMEDDPAGFSKEEEQHLLPKYQRSQDSCIKSCLMK